MKTKWINSERVVSLVGFLFLLLAVGSALYFNGDKKSIIELFADSKTVIIATHALCAAATFVMIFVPNAHVMICVLMVESVLTILTDYEQLGIFFFYAAFLLLLSKNIFTKHVKGKMIFLYSLHILSILLSYTHGWAYTLVAFGTSIFQGVFYIWIYKILKSKFSCFIPKNVTENLVLAGLKPGSELILSAYPLSERQITFILDNMHSNLSYKELSEKHYVSISTVKKDFMEIFQIFGVSKLEELHLLLLQYQVKK